MSSTNIEQSLTERSVTEQPVTERSVTEQAMPARLALALMNSLFPPLDSQLRAGRHVSMDELDNHAFLMDFQPELEAFYLRYNVELIRAPEGFFYLRPRSTTLIPRSVLSELDMLTGKILCYLYLSPERLANEGIFTQQELYDEMLTLMDENRLLKLVNNRSIGSDLDRQKLQEKLRACLNRLRRLGMIWFMGHDCSKFRISEAVFRFGADVRSGDDPRAAQLRMIRDGEAMPLGNEAVRDNADEDNAGEDNAGDGSVTETLAAQEMEDADNSEDADNNEDADNSEDTANPEEANYAQETHDGETAATNNAADADNDTNADTNAANADDDANTADMNNADMNNVDMNNVDMNNVDMNTADDAESAATPSNKDVPLTRDGQLNHPDNRPSFAVDTMQAFATDKQQASDTGDEQA